MISNLYVLSQIQKYNFQFFCKELYQNYKLQQSQMKGLSKSLMQLHSPYYLYSGKVVPKNTWSNLCFTNKSKMKTQQKGQFLFTHAW